jgi:hypothetical protein
MAYSADSFVADEQPTTAKWNKLWNNDASFNDGTGFLTGSASVGIPAGALKWEAWTSHNPTTTGWSGTPTKTTAYMRAGNACLYRFIIDGTSNTTGAVFSAPFAAQAMQIAVNGSGNDNGTSINLPVRFDTAAGSANITAYPSPNGTVAWTASGQKTVAGFLIFEID